MVLIVQNEQREKNWNIVSTKSCMKIAHFNPATPWVWKIVTKSLSIEFLTPSRSKISTSQFFLWTKNAEFRRRYSVEEKSLRTINIISLMFTNYNETRKRVIKVFRAIFERSNKITKFLYHFVFIGHRWVNQTNTKDFVSIGSHEIFFLTVDRIIFWRARKGVFSNYSLICTLGWTYIFDKIFSCFENSASPSHWDHNWSKTKKKIFILTHRRLRV